MRLYSSEFVEPHNFLLLEATVLMRVLRAWLIKRPVSAQCILSSCSAISHVAAEPLTQSFILCWYSS